jgi:hypothetical protein
MGPVRCIFPLILTLTLSLAAVEIPAGTEISVRLKSKLSSKESKPKDAVEAVVIAPLVLNGAIAIEAGAVLHGVVKAVQPYKSPQERAQTDLEFNELRDASGAKAAINASVKEVENARESVTESGAITGIDPSQTISARLDQGLGKLSGLGSLGKLLESAKATMIKPPDPEIAYEPGVELIVAFKKSAAWTGKTPGATAGSFAKPEALETFVNAQPFRTVAASPPQPSDLTNLMFIATPEALAAAFKEAGWIEAAALSGSSKFETFRSIAESRGYKEAPMSVLLLDGKKADFDFEKQLNTFAMRHHLRIWKRPDTWESKPIWVCAATHDIGIEVSQEKFTFIHKIDSRIDRERAKVVSDLLFTGKVKSIALIGRPAVPLDAKNATGDNLETDGAMAVLEF